MDIANLETINIGIVGHIDHGKTTLLQHLSGKWADTHSEEQKRGITIKLGYADAIIKKEGDKYTTDPESKGEPVRYITFIDTPGHEMLMATMLSGAAIIDAAILLVSASEGIKPQTREHLIALEAKNIKNIIIAQNKIDLVTKEQATSNYKQIKEFVKGTIAENAPIIPISAKQGVNIDKILEELCKIKIEKKDENAKPLLLIARSFDINKPGTELKNLHGGILGGILKKGTLKVGDEIEIKPGLSQKKHNEFIYTPIKSKIISIYKGHYKVDKATPGGSIAIETELDTSLTKADSLAGTVASTIGGLSDTTNFIKLQYDLFKNIAGEDKVINPIILNETLMLSVNTSITVGIVSKVSKNEVELKLKIPIVPIKEDSIGISRNVGGHWRLIGFGKINL